MSHRRFLDVLRLSSAYADVPYRFVLSWSLVGAMSYSCLVIASDTSPVREIVEADYDGLLVDFFSPAALAENIIWALERGEQMPLLRDQARPEIEGNDDLERGTLPRMLVLLQELAS